MFRRPDDTIPALVAGADGADGAAGRQFRRHVLEAVDEQVDAARPQLGLEVLRPERFARRGQRVQRRRFVGVAQLGREGVG